MSSRSSFRILDQEGVRWLHCQALSSLPWMVHAFGTRSPDWRSGSSRADEPSESSRWARFLEAIGADGFGLASLCQVHSADVCVVSGDDAGLRYRPAGRAGARPDYGASPAGEALLTSAPGILVSIRTADCMPILLADPRRRCVAVIHAGWRGTLARVIERAAGDMQHEFGSHPEDLLATIGPSIRSCCYEVGEEVLEAFCRSLPSGERFFSRSETGAPHAAERRAPVPVARLSAASPRHGQGRHIFLDLVVAAVDQLRTAGLRPESVCAADFCTACRTDLFFSHRKEGQTGRMVAVVGIRP